MDEQSGVFTKPAGEPETANEVAAPVKELAPDRTAEGQAGADTTVDAGEDAATADEDAYIAGE